MTPSQIRSELQRIQQKNRLAAQKLKSAAQQFDRNMKRLVDDRNRRVRDRNRAINSYNQKARAHNTQVRANRERLRREIARLNQLSHMTHGTYRASVETLHQSFTRIESAADTGSWVDEESLLDLSEGETANSVAALNALLETDDRSPTDHDFVQLQTTRITDWRQSPCVTSPRMTSGCWLV